MKATVMYGAGDVRIEKVPDARLIEPSGALLRVTRGCICGSDLWPYTQMTAHDATRVMGHEAIGVVDAVGAGVRIVKPGDVVVMPCAFSDGTCVLCHDGLQTSCVHGGFFGSPEVPGAQAEAVRAPQADGTLVALPVGEDDALMLDVMGTGHHAAVAARVLPGRGAVGLCGVIAAKRLGAEQIIWLGRHPDRIALGCAFGAADIVGERGEDAIERIRKLTMGSAPTRSWSASATTRQSRRPSRSFAPGARSDESVSRSTSRSRRRGTPSTTTSRSTAARRRYARTSRSCSRTYSKDAIEPGRVFDRTGSLDDVPRGLPVDERARSPEVPDQTLGAAR
jgi:threonine dehydrogenase-like Zn-dependent dehydrogenase